MLLIWCFHLPSRGANVTIGCLELILLLSRREGGCGRHSAAGNGSKATRKYQLYRLVIQVSHLWVAYINQFATSTLY